MADGPKMARVDKNAPDIPPILYPINVALTNIGPGVICPSVMASINSVEFNQWYFSTMILWSIGIMT